LVTDVTPRDTFRDFRDLVDLCRVRYRAVQRHCAVSRDDTNTARADLPVLRDGSVHLPAQRAIRLSARFGVAAPDATIADAPETLASAPDAAPFWAHAFTETATTNAPTAIPSPSIFFIDFASC
jgi:hypothetical protein